MGYANDQRILQTIKVEEILKDKCPIDKDLAVSTVMYEMGYTKEKAREFIKLLFDVNKLEEDRVGLLSWKGK